MSGIQLRKVDGVYYDQFKRVWVAFESDVLEKGKPVHKRVIVEAKSGLIQTADFYFVDEVDPDDEDDGEDGATAEAKPKGGDGVTTCSACGKPLSKGAQERGHSKCRKCRKEAKASEGGSQD